MKAMVRNRQRINQPSMLPTAKTFAGGFAGAVTVVVVWALNMLHVAVPPEVASAFTVIIFGFTSYFVRERVPVAADSTRTDDS